MYEVRTGFIAGGGGHKKTNNKITTWTKKEEEWNKNESFGSIY